MAKQTENKNVAQAEPPISPADIIGTETEEFPTLEHIRGKCIALAHTSTVPFWGLRGNQGLNVSIGENKVAVIPDDLTEEEYGIIRQSVINGTIMFVPDESYKPTEGEGGLLMIDMSATPINGDAFYIHDFLAIDKFTAMVERCDKLQVLQRLLQLEMLSSKSTDERKAIVRERIELIQSHLNKEK